MSFYHFYYGLHAIMPSLQGMPGAPNMKMYSRDDLMNMNNLGNEDADEDDDDNAADFPSNLVFTVSIYNL